MGETKPEAPAFPTTKQTSEGLYGSSTTNASGTSYAPTAFEKGLVGSAQSGITSNLGSLLTGDYSNDANYNTYKDNLRRQQSNAFENTVVNPLISRGLLGTTGAKNLASMYGSTMAQQESNLIDNYRNQLLQNLNTSAQMYSMPYDMMQGTSGLSQSLANAVSNLAAQNYATQGSMYNADQARNAAMYEAVGNVAGAAASDKKVKKNIKKIGEKNGINIYEFEYRPEYNLPKGKHIGVIAQEVEHISNAVIQGKDYKLVDYSVILPLIA